MDMERSQANDPQFSQNNVNDNGESARVTYSMVSCYSLPWYDISKKHFAVDNNASSVI